MLHDLELKNMTDEWNKINAKIDFKKIDENNIMDLIGHGHESISLLRKKFGFEYPVIAVKRDRHEVFYSLYKHVIFDLKRANALHVYEYFKNMTIDELFFYKTEDISTPEKRLRVINDFLLKNKLIERGVTSSKNMTLYSDEYVVNIIDILITPSSHWHNHDRDIIWFDIKDLGSMENWVSEKIGKPFHLKQVNSSQHIDCVLTLDESFKSSYNRIYDFYDLPKEKMTLI
jgi:hypothetical protein